MQLAPSLHRIGNDLVNVYLVADANGVTVIDAGVSGIWNELEPELSAMGRTLADVATLLATLGCHTATNLDGGSSKRMIVDGVTRDLPTTEITDGTPGATAPVRPVYTAVLVHAAQPKRTL